jgi:hypothetical protein
LRHRPSDGQSPSVRPQGLRIHLSRRSDRHQGTCQSTTVLGLLKPWPNSHRTDHRDELARTIQWSVAYSVADKFRNCTTKIGEAIRAGLWVNPPPQLPTGYGSCRNNLPRVAPHSERKAPARPTRPSRLPRIAGVRRKRAAERPSTFRRIVCVNGLRTAACISLLCQS